MRLAEAVPVVVGLIERSNGHNRIAVVATDGRNVGVEQFCPFGMVLCAEIQVVFPIIDIVVIALEIHAGGIKVDGDVDLTVACTESLNLGNLFHSAFELVGAFAGGDNTLRGNEGIGIEGYADDIDNVGGHSAHAAHEIVVGIPRRVKTPAGGELRSGSGGIECERTLHCVVHRVGVEYGRDFGRAGRSGRSDKCERSGKGVRRRFGKNCTHNVFRGHLKQVCRLYSGK